MLLLPIYRRHLHTLKCIYNQSSLTKPERHLILETSVAKTGLDLHRILRASKIDFWHPITPLRVIESLYKISKPSIMSLHSFADLYFYFDEKKIPIDDRYYQVFATAVLMSLVKTRDANADLHGRIQFAKFVSELNFPFVDKEFLDLQTTHLEKFTTISAFDQVKCNLC
jgi:hypothetical protein